MSTSDWHEDYRLIQETAINLRRNGRFVDDNEIVTSAGVSAGIDMALYLVARLARSERAREIRRDIQYDPAPLT